MTATARKITKVLAAKQDLLLGAGVISQLRGTESVDVDKINLPFVFTTIAGIKQADPAMHQLVQYSANGSSIEYYYSSTSTATADDIDVLLPISGVGRWLRSANFVDLADNDGSKLVGFSHSNTYARGTIGEKLKHTVLITDAPWNAKGDGTDEYTTIKAAWDYCLANGYDLKFPGGRTYSCGNNNFPFKADFPASSLLDCKNITVYGDGPSTVLKTASANGADVLNCYSVKNLHFKDLQVEATLDVSATVGSNGISVVAGFDNLTFENVWCKNLPYVDNGVYLDGGKALTIQPGTPATVCGALKATIFAKGCVHGAGVEVDLANWATQPHAIDITIVAEDCYQGVQVSAGEAVSALNADMTMGVKIAATLVNCQQDVVLARAHGAEVDAIVVTTKTAAARRLNPAGAVWRASDSIVSALTSTYAKNSAISIAGDKGACDYKVRIGGASVGSSGLDGYTSSCSIFLDIGGTAATADIDVITASAVFTLKNNVISFSHKMATSPAALPAALFTPSLANIITVGSTPRFINALVAGAMQFTQTDGVTSYNKLEVASATLYASQNFASSVSAKVFGIKDHTGAEKLFVRNDGALGTAIYGNASAFSTPTKVVPIYKEDNTLMGYLPVYTTYTP